MQKVYGDNCLARSKVHKWFNRFKNGREDLNDDERPGRPEGSNRAELVEKVREIIAVVVKLLMENTIYKFYIVCGQELFVLDLNPERKQLFLLHDNALPHKTKKVREFLMKKQICVIDHPPYSPDLSPCDYFLFPKLKTAMKGAFYDDIPAIQAAVTQVLKDIPLDDMKESMHKLVDRSKRCIELNGDYFE
ncbi:histone-lysine N-methyltransferase SETMAR-like [Nylanderia fulva]|uniref:histone-lysine N-methyltransferase SETMAR-like n=1 Tax=Nylanderia fulva TaxID=613905 RepID=UPI0010FB378A|nr:histone-lysine N-methyltransferase SETMAR-like [Nylanderia fulva]